MLLRCTPQEWLEAIDVAVKGQDVLLDDFDPARPDHLYAAVCTALEDELNTHLHPDDLCIVRAYITLVAELPKHTPESWARVRALLDPAPPPAATPRCSPDSPMKDHIDYEDPENAPPHGDARRYNQPAYACRCDFCRAANTAYRSRLKANVSEPPAYVGRM